MDVQWTIMKNKSGHETSWRWEHVGRDGVSSTSDTDFSSYAQCIADLLRTSGIDPGTAAIATGTGK